MTLQPAAGGLSAALAVVVVKISWMACGARFPMLFAGCAVLVGDREGRSAARDRQRHRPGRSDAPHRAPDHPARLPTARTSTTAVRPRRSCVDPHSEMRTAKALIATLPDDPAPAVGPGWGDTRVVTQLIRRH